MRHTLVAVLSGTQARCFNYEPTALTLTELTGLRSPEHELHGQELWSTLKPGRNRGTSGQAHSYDDHRANHRLESERRFAHQVIEHLVYLQKTHHAEVLILAAEPQFLGILRSMISPTLQQSLEITELAKELCNLTSTELHHYLAKKELLPEPKRLLSQ
jgi:protein required for attachment to host cells